MSSKMSNKLSVREGLIRVENAERFQSKPEADGHVHVIVMQKSGKSLRYYTILRTANERLSIGERFWGDYVCYIVDMSSRQTKIDQDFLTRDHITPVHVTVDIAYKAIDGKQVALGIDDALLALRDEISNYLKKDISKLALNQVKEDFLEGRIYQEAMRLQSWTGLNVQRITVSLQWSEEILKQLKADREKRRKHYEEDKDRHRRAMIDDEDRKRSQRLEKEDIDHVDILLDKMELASMPADVKLKLMALPREQAYLEIANFIDETRKQYQTRKLERDEREYNMLLTLMENGTLEDMDMIDLGQKLLTRHMNIREQDQDMDLSASVLFGKNNKHNGSRRIGDSSSQPKQITRLPDETEED